MQQVHFHLDSFLRGPRSPTAKMARALPLLCVIAVAEGVAFAGRGGVGVPLRIRSTTSSRSLLGPGIAGGHDVREMGRGTCAMRRSTSQSRDLSKIGEEENNFPVTVHAVQDTSVYEPVHQRVRRWCATPVTAPPLLNDLPDWEHIYIKTKLYPNLSF